MATPKKTSEILRAVRDQVAASPHPMDHRTWPAHRGIEGVTKAEVLRDMDATIGWFEARGS